MRKRSLTRLALALVLIAVSPAVSAATIAIDFFVVDSGPLGADTELQGSLSFSTDAVDGNADPGVGSYAGVVTSLEIFMVGGSSVASLDFDPSPSIQNNLFVSNGSTDLVTLRAPVVSNPFGVLYVGITLSGPSEVLASDAVPTAAQLNQLGTSIAWIQLFQDHTVYLMQPLAHIAVPEPGTWALLAVLSLLGVCRRARP